MEYILTAVYCNEFFNMRLYKYFFFLSQCIVKFYVDEYENEPSHKNKTKNQFNSILFDITTQWQMCSVFTVHPQIT